MSKVGSFAGAPLLATRRYDHLPLGAAVLPVTALPPRSPAGAPRVTLLKRGLGCRMRPLWCRRMRTSRASLSGAATVAPGPIVRAVAGVMRAVAPSPASTAAVMIASRMRSGSSRRLGGRHPPNEGSDHKQVGLQLLLHRCVCRKHRSAMAGVTGRSGRDLGPRAAIPHRGRRDLSALLTVGPARVAACHADRGRLSWFRDDCCP